MKRIFFHSRTRYLMSAGFALLIVLLKLFSSGDFTLLRSYSDGFFIAGFFLRGSTFSRAWWPKETPTGINRPCTNMHK